MMRLVFAFVVLALLSGCAGQSTAKPDCTNTAELLPGDFNGDRIPDFGAFSGCPGDYKLSVTLAGKTAITHKIDLQDLARVSELSARVVPPGEYQTTCAKGYGPACGEGEISELTLDRNGIVLTVEETSSVLVYWDGSEFQKLGLTD